MKKDFKMISISYMVMIIAGTSGAFDMWFGNWKAGFHSPIHACLWIVDTCLGVQCDVIMARFQFNSGLTYKVQY